MVRTDAPVLPQDLDADETRDSRELRQSILNRAEALGVGMGSLVLKRNMSTTGAALGGRKLLVWLSKLTDAIDTTR